MSDKKQIDEGGKDRMWLTYIFLNQCFIVIVVVVAAADAAAIFDT